MPRCGRPPPRPTSRLVPRTLWASRLRLRSSFVSPRGGLTPPATPRSFLAGSGRSLSGILPFAPSRHPCRRRASSPASMPASACLLRLRCCGGRFTGSEMVHLAPPPLDGLPGAIISRSWTVRRSGTSSRPRGKRSRVREQLSHQILLQAAANRQQFGPGVADWCAFWCAFTSRGAFSPCFAAVVRVPHRPLDRFPLRWHCPSKTRFATTTDAFPWLSLLDVVLMVAGPLIWHVAASHSGLVLPNRELRFVANQPVRPADDAVASQRSERTTGGGKQGKDSGSRNRPRLSIGRRRDPGVRSHAGFVLRTRRARPCGLDAKKSPGTLFGRAVA